MADPGDVTVPAVFGKAIRAVLFDLDGVVTRTATIHARAWQRLFDEFLAAEGEDARSGPFRLPQDYIAYIDGKPRYEGVRSFLESRGIDLPWGNPDDPPDARTVCGLGNRKNRYFHEVLGEEGVEVFPSTVARIRALRARHQDRLRLVVEELPAGPGARRHHRSVRRGVRRAGSRKRGPAWQAAAGHVPARR